MRFHLEVLISCHRPILSWGVLVCCDERVTHDATVDLRRFVACNIPKPYQSRVLVNRLIVRVRQDLGTQHPPT